MQPVWQSKPGRKQKHRFIQSGPFNYPNGDSQQFVQFQSGQQQMDFRMSHYAPNANGEMEPVMFTQNGQYPGYPNGPTLQTVMMPIHKKDKAPSPILAPPIKYPTEDLDVPLKNRDFARPDVKYFTDFPLAGIEDDEDCPTGKFEEKSMGPLLEVWNTLNVHNEVFVLDSFTFDDFVQSLRWSSDDMECELLSEIHCAILKQFVNEKGELQARLPAFEESSSDEESGEESEEEEPTPEPSPPRRTTRRSLKEAEAVEMAKNREPSPPLPFAHRGQELQHASPWQPRCKDRDFRNNMWQPIIAGLLYQLSLDGGRQSERCDTILSKLLPPDEDPTDETVIENYAYLDVNLRIKILEILIKTTYSTTAIREQLERMSAELTDLRKKKAEQQRARKD
jgi:alpha-1,3-glucosyltransferase